ncbi:MULTISPECIES: hypothetical protein [unclassified Dyella]|uniref:hypothetical protein n=1 Tax=Dyella sp. ASV21 TaxID=2795114 RepID=UPI0018ECAD7A|nr:MULTISPECIES: hypothetical protein [unclassified Dyella]
MKIRNSAMLLACVLAMVGCKQEPRIVQLGNQSLKDAIDTAVAHAPKGRATELKHVRDQFVEAYIEHPRAELPDAQAVAGMTLTQFERFTTSTLKGSPEPLKPPADPPSTVHPSLNSGYFASLKLDKELLENTREASRDKGLYTVDQFDWPRPAFVPPPDGAYVIDDHATFAVNFVNRTTFDVYGPVYHLTISEPESGDILFDDDLKMDDKTAIPPDTPVLLTYTCCNIATDPLLNQRMKKLPPNAKFEWHLVSVMDYTRRNMLDTTQFSDARYERLKQVTKCIDDMDKRLETWTPETAAEGCHE